MASDEQLREAFNTFDLDGKGTISAKEMDAVLKAVEINDVTGDVSGNLIILPLAVK